MDRTARSRSPRRSEIASVELARAKAADAQVELRAASYEVLEAKHQVVRACEALDRADQAMRGANVIAVDLLRCVASLEQRLKVPDVD